MSANPMHRWWRVSFADLDDAFVLVRVPTDREGLLRQFRGATDAVPVENLLELWR